ncbi:MAG: phosphate signaling complex protein PhoU [Spirochaetes bacterium]|uniref:Phosphate-specific transport system accessory protein PhoU n=1 Tax=Candidatus Avitreponema avistercoris TaxID=2840705 RepID=A0A9D9EMC0_9SPIR|nr:phosphate signaling complex protein PhoU [Candidatus Avitreponema avistercoris]
MRAKFEQQLKELNDGIVLMGVQCEDGIRAAVQALIDGEKDKSAKAISLEKDIDMQEDVLRALCMRLLLQQQPVAGDLRFISSALKIITDMERLGDQAADIAEIAEQNEFSEGYNKKHISDMADAVIQMITDVVSAFVKKDMDLANAVIRHDDVVDDLFYSIRRDLVGMICDEAQHPRQLAEQALNLLLVAKYLERMGDHIVNIAENVIV